jgi:hypothetical protein
LISRKTIAIAYCISRKINKNIRDLRQIKKINTKAEKGMNSIKAIGEGRVGVRIIQGDNLMIGRESRREICTRWKKK